MAVINVTEAGCSLDAVWNNISRQKQNPQPQQQARQ